MNAEKFKEIFLPYHQKLYRIAYRMLQDQNNAQDILQEAYIKLWEKRGELREINNTESFAVVVLKNMCLDFLRKPKHETREQYNMEPASYSSLSEQMDMKEKLNKVEQIINNLPEQQRLVMMLKHWDDYSDKEIEEITGLNAVNIRVILSRARKVVKEQFKKNAWI